MFQFTGFPLHAYVFNMQWLEFFQTGFPIQKSADQSLICSSPQLFAAYHVFLRLLVPRHPPCALISLTITLLHSVATVGRSELFSVCNLRYLCLLLNDFSFFLRIFRCASDVLKLACSFLYKHLFLDISVCSFQCTIFIYEVFRLRLETERFELLTPCLQGRCSPNWATPPRRIVILFDGLKWTRTIDLTLIRRAL